MGEQYDAVTIKMEISQCMLLNNIDAARK